MTEYMQELLTARETNRKLNRRCQQLESMLVNHKNAEHIHLVGYEQGAVMAEKQFEQQLANYKRATRKGFKRMRDDFHESLELALNEIERLNEIIVSYTEDNDGMLLMSSDDLLIEELMKTLMEYPTKGERA